MKKNPIWKTLLCLAALLAAVSLVGCSNDDDDDDSGGGSGGGSTTTVLSGKVYTGTESDGSAVSISFAASGDSVVIMEDNVVGYGTYTMSGTTVVVVANGATNTLVYTSATDSLYWTSEGITLAR